MLKNKLLFLSAISALFVSSIVADETKNCPSGSCFVKLDRTDTPKDLKQKEELLKVQIQEYMDKELDKSTTIVLDGEETIVFPQTSYTNNDNIIVAYEEEEASLLVTDDTLEEQILEKVIRLPNSEYFCEKDSMPVVHKKSGFYECV